MSRTVRIGGPARIVPALRRVRALALAALVIPVSGCAPEDAGGSADDPPPQVWSALVVESPLDPWVDDPRGAVRVIHDGEVVWERETEGLQNAQAWIGEVGIYLPERTVDVAGARGTEPESRARNATQGAEIVLDGLYVDDQARGLALFNNGFSDTTRGYTFMATGYADGRVPGPV